MIPKHLSRPACAALLVSLAPAQFGSQFDLQTTFASYTAGPSDFEVIDLDGDGDNDLVVCGHFAPALAVYENLGYGTFGPAQFLPNEGGVPLSGPGELATGDFDGDGFVDVAVVMVNTGTLAWWRSNGDGTFAVEELIADGMSAPADVVAFDVDSDGDTDLFTAAFGTNDIGLHMNLGGGVFAPRTAVASSLFWPRGFAFGDLDQDGIADLAVCVQGAGRVTWHRGLGGNLFDQAQIIADNLSGAGKLVLRDVDSDGNVDIMATFTGSDAVVLLRNTGGAFAAVQFIDSAVDDAFGIDAADIDFDGDPDLAVTSLGDNNVRIYENLGSGAFGPPIVVDGNKGYPWAVAIVDADGDQDLDLVSSGRSSAAIFLNRNEATIGTVYCTSNSNSTGSIGTLRATGAANVTFQRLALRSTELPLNSFGYFITSQTQGVTNMPAGSQGVLCLSGAIGRYIAPSEVQFSGASQSFALTLDVNQMPQPLGATAIQAGSTWNFQAWHRDAVGGVATSNFTEAASVTFQ